MLKAQISWELKGGGSEQAALCKIKEQKDQRNWEQQVKRLRLSILERSPRTAKEKAYRKVLH